MMAALSTELKALRKFTLIAMRLRFRDAVTVPVDAEAHNEAKRPDFS